MPRFELHTPQPCLCAYNQPAALMVKNPIDIISLQVEERSSIGISDETIDKTNQSNKRTIIAIRNQKVYFHFYK